MSKTLVTLCGSSNWRLVFQGLSTKKLINIIFIAALSSCVSNEKADGVIATEEEIRLVEHTRNSTGRDVQLLYLPDLSSTLSRCFALLHQRVEERYNDYFAINYKNDSGNVFVFHPRPKRIYGRKGTGRYTPGGQPAFSFGYLPTFECVDATDSIVITESVM